MWMPAVCRFGLLAHQTAISFNFRVWVSGEGCWGATEVATRIQLGLGVAAEAAPIGNCPCSAVC